MRASLVSCLSVPGPARTAWRPNATQRNRSSRRRIPGSKAVGATQSAVRKALATVNKEEASITAAFAPEKKADGAAALAGLKQVRGTGRCSCSCTIFPFTLARM